MTFITKMTIHRDDNVKASGEMSIDFRIINIYYGECVIYSFRYVVNTETLLRTFWGRNHVILLPTSS